MGHDGRNKGWLAVDKQAGSESRQRNMFSNIVIVTLFVGLMTSAIVYFNSSSPNVQREIMQNLATQFERSATNAHWQWQAEGRPPMIMLVQYDNQGKETGRRPVRMAANGWPTVESQAISCESLWENLLFIPSQVDGFRVIAEYYQIRADQDADSDSEFIGYCRYRVSTGPHFDYYVNNGRVKFDD